jgi:hypothetical protein
MIQKCNDVMAERRMTMENSKNFLDAEKISEILKRGNTVEVKETKKGITILEVSRKIRYKEDEDEEDVKTRN